MPTAARKPDPRRSIEYMLIGDVRPAKKNPKLHALDEIAASVARFGFIEPSVMDERTERLISGHGRLDTLDAAERSGEIDPPDGVLVDDDGRWLIPIVRGWRSKNDREAKAALVALNELTTKGGWDMPELASLLTDISRSSDGLDGVGFTPVDLAGMLADLNPGADETPGADTDPAPKPKRPKSRTGDLWDLGPHRLLIGDARDPAAYDRLLAGDPPPAMMWTDPPYGVSVVGGTGLTIENDDLDHDDMVVFLRAFISASVARLRPGATIQMCSPSGPEMAPFAQVVSEAGIWRQSLVWVKNSLVLSRHDFHYRHEFIFDLETPEQIDPDVDDDDRGFGNVFHGWKPGAGHHRPARRDVDTVLHFARPSRSDVHPTMKPLGLVEFGLEHHTDQSELVLDPFGGSGTTLIACVNRHRVARLIELDPGYGDVIARRWQEHTGDVPLRNGKTCSLV